MQTREIDLLDMMADILSHWRGLVVSLLLGAILFGGLSYLKSYRSVQNVQQQERIVQDEVSIQTQLRQMEDSLDDVKRMAVLKTLDDEKEYELKNAYYENSVYMQLDPLQVAKTELIYQVKAADGIENGQLVAIYKVALDNVGLYQWVSQQTGIDASSAERLISVEAISSFNLSNETQKLTLGTDCIRVTLLQVDAESCQKLSDAVKTYISEQQTKLNGELEEHSLILVSETSGIGMNKNVMNDQIDYRNEVISLQSGIAASKADFTEDQTKYYELLTWEDKEQMEQSGREEKITDVVAQTPVVSKKYVLLGAVLFAFIYVLVLCMQYIFNTKIRVSDELQKLYGVPQIGLVVKESGKKVFLDKWVDSLYHYGKREFSAEQSMELAFAAVKIAAMKNGLNSICLMGCNMSAGAGAVCESLKVDLEKELIKVTILDNVLYNAETLEKVDTMQGAVLVEKAGSTLYNEIVSELDLLKRQEIPVLGGIIVE